MFAFVYNPNCLDELDKQNTKTRGLSMLKQMTFSMMGLAVIGSLANMAFASYEPGRVDVVSVAKMKVISARNGFEKIRKVQLELTKRSGESQPSGMTIKYLAPSPSTSGDSYVLRKTDLVIEETSQDNCGSTYYQAHLPLQQGNGEDRGREEMGGRFNITLVDHSTRLCKDYQEYLWEANVREGYGWCGTVDAVMQLKGNPVGMVSIQVNEF
jgi:hypothetical protein